MRLGDVLVAHRLLTAAQLDAGLRAQAHYGGRLGTNLVEIGAIDLDLLTLGLAKQHGVPAALQKNFDAVTRALAALVPAALAARLGVVPLGLRGDGAAQELWLAARDPRNPTAEQELALATGRRVVVCVAAELRVALYLERLYGIPRQARQAAAGASPGAGLSSADKRAVMAARSLPPFDGVGAFDREEISIGNIAAPVAADLKAATATAAAAAAAATLSGLTTPSSGRATAGGAAAPRPAAGAASAPARPAIDAATAIARLAQPLGRDEIGDTVVDFMRSGFGAGLILIVKQDTALGWKGFAPGVDGDVIQALALPLGPPSVLTLALDREAPFRGRPPAEGAAMDQRLWKLLRTPPPAEVLVLPLAIAGRVANLIYGHALDGGVIPDVAAAELASVGAAASAAFVRLIQSVKSR